MADRIDRTEGQKALVGAVVPSRMVESGPFWPQDERSQAKGRMMLARVTSLLYSLYFALVFILLFEILKGG